jgi:hypothetical protein
MVIMSVTVNMACKLFFMRGGIFCRRHQENVFAILKIHFDYCKYKNRYGSEPINDIPFSSGVLPGSKILSGNVAMEII